MPLVATSYDHSALANEPSSLTRKTMLERIKTLYNPTPGMAPEKIGPTVGQNSALHSLMAS
jgi:hypothetical protein